MEDIASLFREHREHFTIYVVEQRFVVEKGRDFFQRYQGEPNYIDNDYTAKQFLSRIYKWIGPKIPIIGTLLSMAFRKVSAADIGDIIMAFSKLYATQSHQAAGPDVIDPIIIQEGKVTLQNINHIVAIHKESILAPAIIIILRDNDFNRAKKMLSECPNGIYVKYIRNNGKTELQRVINTGAQDIDDFIDAFSKQCFSTCSNTPRNILLNSEWENDPIVKKYAFNLLQFRSNLICDEKTDILSPLNNCINELKADLKGATYDHERILMENFLCISKLFRVFCNDNGGKDITDALSLARELSNDILEANVYKYAFFLPEKNIAVQNELLDKAYNIYSQNGMRDNAIYCKNNKLIRQFDEGKIHSRLFDDLVGEATGDVPGLVGMAHIYNNAGIAHMMTGSPEVALEYFNQGLAYSKSSERFLQRMALECNKMILNTYYRNSIEYKDIDNLVKKIFDGMVANDQLSFISARYIMNLLIVALHQNKSWAKQIIHEYKIADLVKAGLQENSIGSGQLLLQLAYLDKNLVDSNLKQSCISPQKIIPVTGKRKEFIEQTGMNPFYFFTWL